MNQHEAVETLTHTLHRVLERLEADNPDDAAYFDDLAARVARIDAAVQRVQFTVSLLAFLLIPAAFAIGLLLGRD